VEVFIKISQNQQLSSPRNSGNFLINQKPYKTPLTKFFAKLIYFYTEKGVIMKVKKILAILLIFKTFVFADEYKILRQQMVKFQIEGRGIKNTNVLNAFIEVPRHYFVPDNIKNLAYEDRPLPIGYGQTISQPYIVALMTELIKPEPNMKVLEIGTGSGYQAAILSRLVKEVYTVEIISNLLKTAQTKFKELNYTNIYTKWDDGYYGWKENAPYDAIVVTCATEFVPPPLIKQLKVGGVMVIPVGPPFRVQELLLVKKIDKKTVKTSIVEKVIFVGMTREKR
jgi:protein-L-isoaspartate(D-aspartate) O-methyltransferase